MTDQINDGEKDDASVSWWKKHHNWTAIGTVVIGIFTILLVGVGYLQYSVLDSTDETQRVIQSAFIIPHTIEVEGQEKRLKDGANRWDINVSWENTGNTATRNLTIYSAWIAKNGDLNPPPERPAFPNRKSQPGDLTILFRSSQPVTIATAGWPKPPHKTVLGPHQVRYISSISFDGNSMQRLQNGAATLAVAGLAIYEDQFAKRHLTMFCQEVVFPAIDYINGEAGKPYVTKNPDCPEYNCTDEDCRKYKGANVLPDDEAIP